MKTEAIAMSSRPRVLAVLPGFVPSTALTVIKPLTALHRSGRILADISLESWVSRRKVERADVVVFSRNTEPLYAHILETALALGKPIIYDIDDNFFELPLYYQSEFSHRTPERLAQLERYLQTADLVQVYSEPLQARMTHFNSCVVRVEGAVDWSLLPHTSPPRDSQRVRIVYVTSRWTKDDLVTLFIDDLRQILRVYHKHVEFFFWGYHPAELRGHPSVHFLNFVPNYDRFFERFAGFGFDVGLAPLRNEEFYRSKSNNKFREYAACRIAGIYSDVDVYSSCVENEQTGLLVSAVPGAWFTAVSQLVEDAELRTRIQEQAFSYARERYSLEKTQAVWLDHICRVVAAAKNPGPMRQGVFVSSNGEPPYPGGSSNSMRKSPRSLAVAFNVAYRGKRLAEAMKAQGVGAAIKKIQWSLNDLRGLLRVRRQLLGPIRCSPWRRSQKLISRWIPVFGGSGKETKKFSKG